MLVDIISAIQTVQMCANTVPLKICACEYVKPEGCCNQFVILIKPECFMIGVDYKTIIAALLEKCENHHISINGAYALNGVFIRKTGLIKEQYSALNEGAVNGLNQAPVYLVDIIRKKFGNVKIEGAYQFLEENPTITCKKLEELSHIKGSYKLGNGLYAFYFEEAATVVINAFHPHQIEHFTNSDSVVIALICSSCYQYSKIGDYVIGNYNPQVAACNSMRYYIYINRNILGLSRVNIFYNGFHISPSPLEGMFAVIRYAKKNGPGQIGVADTILGRYMLSHGYRQNDIEELSKNPYIKDNGKFRTLFDCAEENKDDIQYVVKSIELDKRK